MLFKALRYIAIYTAAAILLLHMIVPHVHHHEGENQSTISDRQTEIKIFDLFSLFFQQDLGDEHLEEFLVKEKVNHAFDFPSSHAVFIATLNLRCNLELHQNELSKIIYPPESSENYSFDLLRALPMRAPPA